MDTISKASVLLLSILLAERRMVEAALLVVNMMTVIALGMVVVMVVVDLMVDVMIVTVEMTEVMIVDMTAEVVEEVMTAVVVEAVMINQEEVENSVLQETLILVFMLLESQMTVDGLI